MFCEKCGSKLAENAKFCADCGAKVEEVKAEDNTNQEETKTSSQTPPPPPPPPKPQPQPQYNQQANGHYIALDKPLGVGSYLGMILVTAIPIVGIIMLFVWGFGSTVNINKKNFARAYLILILIGIVLGIVFSIVFASLFSVLWNSNFNY